MDTFKNILKYEDEVKPVLIFTVDGGPDENPRYPKVTGFAIEHFKEYNLDAIFIATNSPGRSAYRVERRMAPLSKQLAGLILPHDKFGNHLRGGKCIDDDLELKNFEHAGQTLAEVWNELIIDDHLVQAEYKPPTGQEFKVPPDVRESQYFLQIVKCNDQICCQGMRSDLALVLPDRFIPAPWKIKQDAEAKKLVSGEIDSVYESKFLPLF